MILISTGTINKPFNRLISASIEIFKQSNQKIIIQAGFSNFKHNLPPNFLVTKLIPYRQMTKLYSQAELIVAASGEGTVIDILHHSQYKPILFPRLKKYGEHVNNQQFKIAKTLNNRNKALLATNQAQIKKLVISYQKNILNFASSNALKKLTQNLTKETNYLIEK